MTIRQASPRDFPAFARLVALLWPDCEPDELAPLLESPEAAVFLAEEADHAIAFAQCQLRHDYVEGCETSPVGYLEGVFVEDGHRGRGVGKALVSACQDWAKARGCHEFASDCELDNTDSLRFHLKVGFQEANRIICFKTQL